MEGGGASPADPVREVVFRQGNPERGDSDRLYIARSLGVVCRLPKRLAAHGARFSYGFREGESMLLESQIPTRGFMGGQFGLLRDFQKQYEKRGALVPLGALKAW